MLNDYAARAERRDLDVTLLLTIATSALVIPYERLRPINVNHIADDRTDSRVAALQQLELQPFSQWVTDNSWRIRFRVPREVILGGSIEGWASRDKMNQLDSSIQVEKILRILRNALAHGSIFVQAGARREPNEIHSLVFVAEYWTKNENGRWGPSGDYDIVTCSPKQFERMLRTWIDFLESLDSPPDVQYLQSRLV